VNRWKRHWGVGTLFTLSASSVQATVGLDESAVKTGGFGAWIIDSLFQAGTLTQQPDAPGIIGATIMPLSLIAMLVAITIIVVKSVQHLLVVAQAKDPDQSPVSMTWAPLHMVIAVALIMPLPSGYSMGQYGAIWVAHQSNVLGNLTASKSTNFFRNSGVITPPALPSVQEAVDGIIASQLCKTLNNQAAGYVAANGGVPITVSARRLTESELATIGGAEMKYSAGNGLTRAGVTFERNRQGGFISEGKPIDDYCGAIAVQYTAKSKGLFWGENEVPLQRQAASNINSTPAEKCQFGPLCIGGKDVSFKDAKTQAINTFASAHNMAASKFIGEALNGSTSANIAQTLLWDMDKYFAGKTNAETAKEYSAMQKNEAAKVEAAVEKTVGLMGSMQSSIYSSYAQAINQFATTRSKKSGDNFLDTVDRVGWPMLGLYWMQYTNFSKQVMDSVSVQTIYTGDIDDFIAAYANLVGDPALGNRLKTRIYRYRAALARQIQNSRFDTNPGGMTDASESQTEKVFGSAKDALEIREAFPLMRDELLANAGSGGMNPENLFESIEKSLNTLTRGYIFPYVLAPLREDNLVNALVNTGHNIITVSEIIYTANVLARAANQVRKDQAEDSEAVEEEEEGLIDKAINFVKNPFSTVAGWVASFLGFAWTVFSIVMRDFAEFWFYVFLLGLFLAFYIPAMIMIQWLIGLVTWIIYIVEATIIIPLWGLLFTTDMGQKAFAPQTAQQGFVHLLSILVYPSLMTIGFVIGLKVIDLISTFLVEFLLIGVMNTTDGYVFGILSMVAGLFIIGLACYQIIVRVFSIVLELNDRAMSWIGNRSGYGEGQVEGQVRGGINAVIGKVETQARMGGKKGI